MRNVLFIVTELQSANGICSLNVMRYLQSQGLKVWCISNREYGQDNHFTVDGIDVHTIRPRLTYSIDSRCKKNPKSIINRILHGFGYVINKLQLLCSIPTWPLISPLWTRRICHLSERLCKEYDIDTIIGVYTQIDALIAAHRLKRKNPKLTYIAYFLDSLSGGYGPRYFSQDWIIRRGISWERRVLDNADRVIMMESAKEYYLKNCSSEQYFDKIHFLDLPLFSPKTVKESSITAPSKDTIQITYVGSLHRPIRDPEYILRLFHQFRSPELRLTVVGPTNCANILEYYANIDHRITVLASVSHKEAEELIDSADILLNIGNTNPNMTPSKIFEYMSYGKPILSTAPIKDEPCIKYLERYPLAAIIYQQEEIFDQNIEQVEQFILSHRRSRFNSQQLLEVFASNTPQALYKSICNEDDK